MNLQSAPTKPPKSNIRTIYLVPHSHTDIGYSHDPLATIELHDRFLDRAISLCEATRDYPEAARFRWTVEVFFSALHWWEHRGAKDHKRLVECLQRGEIEIGARYFNGTELVAPEDISWEVAQLERWAGYCGVHPRTVIQNDVNGFPLPIARELAPHGVDTLMMGLNTTMGHSPFPRCTAFNWNIGCEAPWLVWNGWIYNRIKTFCHLDDLARDFHDKAASFLATLPDEYPYDFVMTNATIGDNVGPFPALPDQVRLFNEKSSGLKLQIATFAEVADRMREADAPIVTRSGTWPDYWTFGAGSMPQSVEMTRRAQRRLRIVETFRSLGWASEGGGTLNLDFARAALALACEHTYDSHTSAGEDCGTRDSLRQKAQLLQASASAETASMVLLRDHLAAMAKDCAKTPISVMVANPHPYPLTGTYSSEKKGLVAFATSRRPEHLFQFDREPTVEGLAKAGTFGFPEKLWPGGSISHIPLETLPPRTISTIERNSTKKLNLDGEGFLQFSAQAEKPIPQLDWRTAAGDALFELDSDMPALGLVEERPLTPFQMTGLAEMDPSDAAWNPDLRFERKVIPFSGNSSFVSGADGDRIVMHQEHGLLRQQEYCAVPGHPGALMVTASLHFDTTSSMRAIYLPLPFSLPGDGAVEFWIDSCGTPYRAETDQLPGTCKSFYHVYYGVALHRNGRTAYVVSPDIPLFQCGDFTFGQSPKTPLRSERSWVAAWLYNNYWNTNFPSYSPGWARARFILKVEDGRFDPQRMQQLDAVFDREFLTHPIA